GSTRIVLDKDVDVVWSGVWYEDKPTVFAFNSMRFYNNVKKGELSVETTHAVLLGAGKHTICFNVALALDDDAKGKTQPGSLLVQVFESTVGGHVDPPPRDAKLIKEYKPKKPK